MPEEPIATPVRKRLFQGKEDLPKSVEVVEPSPKKLCHGDLKDGSDNTNQPEKTDRPAGEKPEENTPAEETKETPRGEENENENHDDEEPQEPKPKGLTDRQASHHLVSNPCYDVTLYSFMVLMFFHFGHASNNTQLYLSLYVTPHCRKSIQI